MNRKITNQHYQQAFYYSILGIMCLILAYMVQGPGWLTIYPAMSCLLVGSAYGTNNPAFLGKRSGTYPWMAIILFAPYLIGSWYSWRIYSRKIPAWTEISPGILQGRRLTARETLNLLQQGSVAVLDLAPEIPEIAVLRGSNYQHVPVLDLAPPSIEQLAEAVRFIRSRMNTMRIYIHCSLGLSRSTAVVAAFLISTGMEPETAIAMIRRSRPGIIVSREVQQRLESYWLIAGPGVPLCTVSMI